MEDSLMIKELANDNIKVFNEIYEKYYKRLYSLAIYKTRNTIVSEELVQDIFLSIWEKRKTNQILNLENYLFVSLKYQIIAHLKNLLKTKKVELSEVHFNTPSTTFENFSAEELKEAIENAVEKLPSKTQEIFKLSRFENLSHKEISSLLEISEKTVEYHISQALKTIKVMVQDFI